ncbi:MAG: hypothetical protein VB118_11405 [Oscillospiraceae bacterium]|nr:hypothetical protein [Oscillospiraceae bacterium]
MDFGEYLTNQLIKHPSMQPQDIVKLCYQAAFGAEHLLTDADAAQKYFDNEYDSVSESDGELYEQISQDVCRINLPVWKEQCMPREWLFRMFMMSSSTVKSTETSFIRSLDTVQELVTRGVIPISPEKWLTFRKRYEENGICAIHHSDIYRQKEHPAYRIVSGYFMRIIPLLVKLAALPEKAGANVIVIDGRAAAGKTTIAEQLRNILGAGVVHMDDFFLPPELRTEERFLQPGGNVHYERFASEVLPKLSCEEAFSYRSFDCGRMTPGELRNVSASKWRIVEGSYSFHPSFSDYADLSAFCDVDKDEQLERIRIRSKNSDELFEMFKSRWIPLEEEYFKQCSVKERADIVI